MTLIIATIFFQVLVIILLISIFYIIYLMLNEQEEENEKEERKKEYLKLQNMTTQEILLFKDKKEFIKDVGCYDILREFYNDDEIIKKVYPNYKRID